VSLSGGCNSYPWVVFRENALSPTPYMKVAGHPAPRTWPNDAVTVTWIGHATVLINFYGTVILTDPVLGERLSPPEFFGANLGIRRITELPCTFEQLPPVDVVLLSHAHQDHWDMETLRRFDGRPLAIVPPGDSDLVPPGKFRKVTELGWGETASIGDVGIRAFRVWHWGQRIGAPDKPRGYNGYVISGHGRTVVFIGDSAYGDIGPDATPTSDEPRWVIRPADWAAIINSPSADLCILPIGEYTYHVNHMTPEEAWSVFEAVTGRYILATHWRTFILSPRAQLPTFEPMERLRKRAGDLADRIVCDEPGKVFSLPR
jgi:L-ascorbate metabolism protein UlaG (beta-lactamase superfamily)